VHVGRGCTECSEEDQVMAYSFHPDIEESDVQDRQLVMKRISSLSSADHPDHVCWSADFHTKSYVVRFQRPSPSNVYSRPWRCSLI
jgi:hypothetical protein